LIYAYRLGEVDEDWTIETATEVVYQNLPPGDYRFDVKVQKPGTDFSRPAVLHLEVKATLWQQPLFYVTVAIILFGWLGLLFHRRQVRKRKLIEMDNQLLSLEQKALQSMMNPHFIFNVLGSIQNYLLHSNPNQAGMYLSQFARLIRQNVSAINSNKISIEEEADRLRNYLDLERLRLENNFKYEIEFDESLDDDEELMIPSMIVQPFVENAVWHGIANRKTKGMITIVFSLHSENALKITIEDNGPGIKPELEPDGKGSKHLHLGTQITRKRLEILGKKYGLKATINHEEVFPGDTFPGARIIIVVPVL
jgi:LytS/YehU family sensor histidine kinase